MYRDQTEIEDLWELLEIMYVHVLGRVNIRSMLNICVIGSEWHAR